MALHMPLSFQTKNVKFTAFGLNGLHEILVITVVGLRGPNWMKRVLWWLNTEHRGAWNTDAQRRANERRRQWIKIHLDRIQSSLHNFVPHSTIEIAKVYKTENAGPFENGQGRCQFSHMTDSGSMMDSAKIVGRSNLPSGIRGPI